MRPDLEEKFINHYVLKVKRSRYLGFIKLLKSRGKFLEMLYHGQDLDKSRFQDLNDVGLHENEAITTKLKTLKGILCYVISVNTALDGRELSLTDALAQVVGREGNIIIFGELEAVYYEGEAPYNRYLSL